MEADTATRYRSRILREMNANRENPFNSPPSSTGSHRAGSPTLSSVFSDPEGESTRRLNEDIARVTAPRKLAINWEAAHRKWPEFYSIPNKNERPVFDDITDTQALNARAVIAPKARKLSTHKSAPLIAKYIDDDTTQDAWNGSKRTRAEMQARVENESDLSLMLAKSSPKGMSVHGANKHTHAPSSLAKNYSSELVEASNQRDKQNSISEVLDRLRREPSSPKSSNLQTHDTSSPNMSSAKSSLTAVPTSPSTAGSLGQDASNLRSFFMPDVSHLEDFVTGTLRFTGSVQNGVPILVKHGKVHDQKVKPFAARHAEVDGVAIPEDEEKIFVSMDMIREEIISLQDHHDKIQEYAAHLQREVERLEAQRNSFKSFDGRLAMDLANEQIQAQKKEFEAQVASLQARLDQANQKISSSAIEHDTLAQERDRAINRLQEACEDINKLTRKLSIKEKELETTSKQLGSSEQTRQENDTLRRDLATLKKSRQSLELENASLRTDNENLRKEIKHWRGETESLRSDNNNLRGDHQSLLTENRSLRTANRALMNGNDDDSRENVDGLQHELDAAREEIETLQQELHEISREKSTLREDNDSLVRHNDKYFKENKILRRENSSFERSIRDLHDQILKLNREVTFLKGQPDNSRPIPERASMNERVDEDETEENMTSAFFVPDITMNTDENTETKDMAPALPEVTTQTKDVASTVNDKGRESRSATKREHTVSNEKSQTRSHSKTRVKVTLPKNSSYGQKVAFSLPEKSTQNNKAAYSTQANKGSKRKTSSSKATITDLTAFDQNDDTTGLLSVDDATLDQSVSMNLTFRSIKETGELKPSATMESTHQPQKLQGASTLSHTKPAMPFKKTACLHAPMQEAIKSFGKDSCPALSNKARRVLDSLCGHNCQNCIVCSRITSHNVITSSNELAVGKRRVTVPRPVPVSERQVAGDDPTVRPAQAPGHALALVIKGLEDESQHLQLELMRLQAHYNGSDKSHSRRQRLAQAEAIKMVLKQLEVKNDQIYSLYDVLEGQKAVNQAMSEDEIELTVLNITGMTVQDVTGGTEQRTWERIMDQ